MGVVGLVLLPDLLVLVDSVDEAQSALGVLDVLDSKVDSLWQDIASHSLVDDHTDGVLGDVVDSTSLTVVDLVWHALLDGTVALDVNDVASSVDVHVGGKAWHTLVSEGLGEHVTGTPSLTMSVRHLRKVGLSKSREEFDLRFTKSELEVLYKYKFFTRQPRRWRSNYP